MIAAMRAGSFALGTVGYPTQWRPVSDSTFISYQLDASLAQVTKGLAAKGITIEPATVRQIEDVNKALKKAENDVKENRDILNKYNNMLASGEVKPADSRDATITEMKTIVDKYNENGEIKRHNRNPVPYKVHKYQVKFILDEIKEFYDEVKKYKIEDIICIDETSIKSLQKRNHCYNELGKRCVIKTQSQEVFKKYTGIFAISTKGVLRLLQQKIH
jgi:hypothetical protein